MHNIYYCENRVLNLSEAPMAQYGRAADKKLNLVNPRKQRVVGSNPTRGLKQKYKNYKIINCKNNRGIMMEVIFKIEKQNLQKVKDVLLKDETVSKASITFKESKSLGLKGNHYYCYILGLEEACDKAKGLIKDLTEIVNEKDAKKIIEKIKVEEESAMTGFGDIFG